MAFHGMPWNSTAMPWRPVESHGSPQNSGEISADFLGNSMAFRGVPWTSTAICGKPRNSMVFQGSPRSSTVCYGKTGFSTESRGEPWSFSMVENGGICHDNPRKIPRTPSETPWIFPRKIPRKLIWKFPRNPVKCHGMPWISVVCRGISMAFHGFFQCSPWCLVPYNKFSFCKQPKSFILMLYKRIYEKR